jgi:hypothetical protein
MSNLGDSSSLILNNSLKNENNKSYNLDAYPIEYSYETFGSGPTIIFIT